MYNGYESKNVKSHNNNNNNNNNNINTSENNNKNGNNTNSDKCHSFTIAFGTLEDSLNFCISSQVGLLHVGWPDNILKLPGYVFISYLLFIYLY